MLGRAARVLRHTNRVAWPGSTAGQTDRAARRVCRGLKSDCPCRGSLCKQVMLAHCARLLQSRCLQAIRHLSLALYPWPC